MHPAPPPLPALPSRPRAPLPAGACDAHTHIFGPFDRFPLAPERNYTPPEATPEAHRAMLDAVGFDRGIAVQGSAHGTDNRAIAAALAAAPDRLRGIAVIDDTITDAELAALRAGGFSGARFTQIVSKRYPNGMVGVSDFRTLEKLAPRMREHGLHAQLFANCDTVIAARDLLLSLGIPLVIDHMAKVGQAEWNATSPLYRELLALLREGRLWVKLTQVRSAACFPDYEDARPFHEALLKANPDRLVFGSDWPLLNLGDKTPDVGHLVDRFRDWTGDDALANRILVDNPAALYGF
ncbi:amidohydrolase family protein [Hephaestia sp. GCM10023244]|uniref:amidohydrolase family protein n=1 Tax=unclassified Hephaestia TaxID=2631281 RepID=UPI0020777B20|nr:amidohydrolase family protein [Hephaestia sp. MAHUQ-44]MCM8732051.1 amidohydrolase family protein [Hephaestia sp. MAHUQ-44]